jgi:hypothetical protein
MPDLLSERSSYTGKTFIFPYSLTLISLLNNSIPYNLHSMPEEAKMFTPLVQTHPWEESYVPVSLIDYSDKEKMDILKSFAANLMSDMQDIPVEFAKVLNDNFWELL